MLLLVLSTLVNVDPDCPSYVPRCPNQEGPVFATFGVPFCDVRHQSNRHPVPMVTSHMRLRFGMTMPNQPQNQERSEGYSMCPLKRCSSSQPVAQCRIKPVMRDHVQFTCRSCEIHVITVVHIATNISGTINLGRILPSIRRKVGHLVCRLRSRGPT
jgi:hypothetical protein